MRSSRVVAWLSVLACAVVMLASSPASATYCQGASENTCPETSASYHQITIRTILGAVVDLSGSDTYVIGRTGGLLIACRSGTTLHFLYDESIGDYLYDGLEADSAICWGNGADTVTIARSSFQCSGAWYSSMSSGYYNGYILHMHGQAGSDHLYGGDGPEKLCGGADGDHLLGFGGNDVVDGLSGDDLIQGGSGTDELWGYTGSDCIYDESGADDYLNGESGFDGCIWDNGADFSTLTCDGDGGYTRNSSGTVSCTYSTAGCDGSCTFY